MIYFKFILPLTPWSSGWGYLQVYLHQNTTRFILLPVRATCRAHSNIFYVYQTNNIWYGIQIISDMDQ